MNSLVNAATFAVATFAEASWRCEIFKEHDVGHCRNGLSNLKIVVRIWNATAAGRCVEHIRQQKWHIHADRAVNISVEGIQRWLFYLTWYCYDQPVSSCCLECSRNTPHRWSPFEVYQICQRIQLAWKYDQLVPVVMWPKSQCIDGRQRSVRRLQQ